MPRGRGYYWARLALFALIALATALGLLWIGLAYRVARWYAFAPDIRPLPPATPLDYGVPYQELTLITEEGLRLAAWYTPPQKLPLVWLLAHGYGAHRLPRVHADVVRLTGMGALSWDFRGHGASQGRLRTFGLREAQDVLTAADFARRQLEVERVIAWGTSMGAAAVIWAAAQSPRIHAVVADSPYADLQAIEPNLIRLAPLRPLVRLFLIAMTGLHPQDLRPVDVVERIPPRPLALIHGAQDPVIPVEHTLQLQRGAAASALVWIWSQAGHSQAFLLEPERYWGCLGGLMERWYTQGEWPTGVYTQSQDQLPVFCQP